MSASATSQQQSNNLPTTATEYQVPSPPQHPVSALVFHPRPSQPQNARCFLAASWDSTVKLYQLPESADLDGEAKSAAIGEVQSFSHEAPVLDVCWINDELAASGGIDRRLRMYVYIRDSEDLLVPPLEQLIDRLPLPQIKSIDWRNEDLGQALERYFSCQIRAKHKPAPLVLVGQDIEALGSTQRKTSQNT